MLFIQSAQHTTDRLTALIANTRAQLARVDSIPVHRPEADDLQDDQHTQPGDRIGAFEVQAVIRH